MEFENKLKAVFDVMPDAISIVDEDMRIVFFNKRLNDWCGELCLTTDVTGKDLFEVFPFLPGNVREEYRKVFDSGSVLTTEEWTHIGESRIFTETRKIPILENGKAIMVVSIIRDITARKNSDIKFKEKAEEVEKLNKFMMGRELKIIELKKEVDNLLKAAGKPPKYKV